MMSASNVKFTPPGYLMACARRSMARYGEAPFTGPLAGSSAGCAGIGSTVLGTVTSARLSRRQASSTSGSGAAAVSMLMPIWQEPA